MRRSIHAYPVLSVHSKGSGSTCAEHAANRVTNGALSAIDLRIVQENYRNAALENFLAIYTSIESRVALVRLTGGLIDKAQIK